MNFLTNEILYKVTKALNLDTTTILEIYSLADYIMTLEDLESLLAKKQDENFKECGYDSLGAFLDGLIILKRGESSNRGSDEVVELTNNLILKKLRIALELKESEVEIIFGLGDVELTKQKLSALFRKESNKNFRLCSDELLFAFLDGLDEFYFVGEIE